MATPWRGSRLRPRADAMKYAVHPLTHAIRVAIAFMRFAG